jgi:hypothetical protein
VYCSVLPSSFNLYWCFRMLTSLLIELNCRPF